MPHDCGVTVSARVRVLCVYSTCSVMCSVTFSIYCTRPRTHTRAVQVVVCAACVCLPVVCGWVCVLPLCACLCVFIFHGFRRACLWAGSRALRCLGCYDLIRLEITRQNLSMGLRDSNFRSH